MDRLLATRRSGWAAVRGMAAACAVSAIGAGIGCTLPFSQPPLPHPSSASGEPLLKPRPPEPTANVVPPPAAETAKATAVDDDLLAQLKELDHLDAATKAQLAADLREVDKPLWPFVLLYYRDKEPGAIATDTPMEKPSQPKSTPRNTAKRSTPARSIDEALAAIQAAGNSAPAKAPLVTPNQPAELQAPLPPEPTPDLATLLQRGSGTTTGPQQMAQLAAFAQAEAAAPENAGSATLGWREHLQAAITQLEGQAAQEKGAALGPKLRLLYLAADRGPDALEPCAGLSEGEQQFWTEQMFGLSAALDQNVAPAERRNTLAARHLRQAATHLGQQGLLDLRNANFCRQVDSFGIYKRLNPAGDDFQAGQDALLYAEVVNFTSQPLPDGFHTSLSARYEISDEEGKPVARQDFPPLEETCLNQRQDFFIQHRMTFPKNLARGRYRLRLLVSDVHGQKQGEALLPFTIGGN
jgi:hypothetical protein